MTKFVIRLSTATLLCHALPLSMSSARKAGVIIPRPWGHRHVMHACRAFSAAARTSDTCVSQAFSSQDRDHLRMCSILLSWSDSLKASWLSALKQSSWSCWLRLKSTFFFLVQVHSGQRLEALLLMTPCMPTLPPHVNPVLIPSLLMVPRNPHIRAQARINTRTKIRKQSRTLNYMHVCVNNVPCLHFSLGWLEESSRNMAQRRVSAQEPNISNVKRKYEPFVCLTMKVTIGKGVSAQEPDISKVDQKWAIGMVSTI